MKRFFLIAITIILFSSSQAQSNRALTRGLSLEMPGEKGSNGASMAWHPVFKKYYCAFAGNSSFPLAVFNAAGKRVSDDDLECQFDVRGLWFNPGRKKIEGNGYDDYGWHQLKLDEDGIPFDDVVLIEDLHQPDEQSVGGYDMAKKMAFFLDNGRIMYYNDKGEEAGLLTLKLGEDGVSAIDDETVLEKYNKTACYTGIKGGEFALLNIDHLTIELYDRKGEMSKVLSLPDEVSVNEQFNFSYANGAFWLFDKDTRTWVAYK